MDDVSNALRGFYNRRLADWSARIQRLLDRPSNIPLDPLLATDPESGQLLPEAVARLALGVRRHLHLSVDLPIRSAWDSSDLGPGLDRTELRVLLDDINLIRKAILSRGLEVPVCQVADDHEVRM
jgi:hypothetical protein